MRSSMLHRFKDLLGGLFMFRLFDNRFDFVTAFLLINNRGMCSLKMPTGHNRSLRLMCFMR